MSARGRSVKWLVGLTAFLIVAALIVVNPQRATADNSTFYIDNGPSSGCSDVGSGSSTSPWCNLSAAKAHGAFGPGDQILLRRGDTWSGPLSLTGSGTSTSPIELGAWGDGAMPTITGSGQSSDRDVRIDNGSYWTIGNLHLTNAGDGLLLYYNNARHQGISLHDLYVDRISGIHQGNPSGATDSIWNSAGITVTGVLPPGYTTNDYMLSGLTLTNIEGTHNLSSFSSDWYNGQIANGSQTVIGTNNVQNVTLDHLYFHNDDGAGRAAGCDEGLRLDSVNTLVMRDSILDGEGGCYSSSGTAALILGTVANLNFFNNTFSNVPDTGSHDQVAVDFEYREQNVVFDGNVFTGNAGAGLSFLDIHPDDSTTNITVQNNTFMNNGVHGALRADKDPSFTTSEIPTGTIRNNLFYEPNYIEYTEGSGTFSGFATTNNPRASSASDIYASQLEFSSTQGANNWYYQYLNGSSFTALSLFDSVHAWWQRDAASVVPLINKFDMHPGTGQTPTVSRTWIAPKAGTISIRGLQIKADSAGGDGVLTAITLNGAQIWPSPPGPASLANSDRSGKDAYLDGVSVAQGDSLKFLVHPGTAGDNQHDLTSWVPVAAYTG